MHAQNAKLAKLVMMCESLRLTWPLLGRVGLAGPPSAEALSVADEDLAEEGLNNWRVALEGPRGLDPSWEC